MTQAGDVLIFQGVDDGDIESVDGIITMTAGLESMYYLILVGGNENDINTPDTKHLEWLGNEDEPVERQYRGRVQALLNGMPITSGTMQTLKDACIDDLSVGFGDLITALDCTVYALSTNRVKIETILILANGVSQTLAIELDKKS
jgi:hypothetical protein